MLGAPTLETPTNSTIDVQNDFSFTAPAHPAPAALAHPCASAADQTITTETYSRTTTPNKFFNPDRNRCHFKLRQPPLPRQGLKDVHRQTHPAALLEDDSVEPDS
jgi:hypothetical protein